MKKVKEITLPNGKVVPVFSAVDSEPSAETVLLREVCARASAEAVRRAFAAGVPITVAKGERIVEIYPDGREKDLGALHK